MTAARRAPVSQQELDRLIGGAHHDPHRILGAHAGAEGVTVRVLRPLASTVDVVLADGRRFPMDHERDGVFVAPLPLSEIPDYRLTVAYGEDTGNTGNTGNTVDSEDPYRFWPTLGEMDLHLIGEGRHEQLWQVLGAHVRAYETGTGTVNGTSFAVWAPNAQGVRIVGDFNHWDGRAHPMRSLGSAGVWELFIPGVGEGTRYKYAVLGSDGVWRQKADPMAFATENPPATASVVFTSHYQWGDEKWLTARAQRQWSREPMSIYELHLGSWRKGRDYRQLAGELVDYVLDMGFTHVELMPVVEHPYAPSWGYQVSSYYAPTSRFGSPDEFRHLVDRLHRAGIGVLVDWVPAHFPKDEWALGRFDGTPLYEHADPRRGEHPDWGTYVFDYGRREVRNFLIANAVYLLEEFHIDGLRVDAVASMLYLDYSREGGDWLPNVHGGREDLDAVSFLKEANATCYRRAPGVIMVAEESTAWPGVTKPTDHGGLGFGFKWNMGWMHDTLEYLAHEPVHREHHHNEMTFSMMYAYTENYILPLSHDEVVHGKRSLVRKAPGDDWQQFATLRGLLAYMWAHPGKQLLFMGSEFGQTEEWSDERGLDWWLLDHAPHAGVQKLVRDLNAAYLDQPALWSREQEPEAFRWIQAGDAAGNTFSFVRFGDDGSTLVCVANFAAVPHEDYRLGLPHAGNWRELVNTDVESYGGGGVGNLGRVEAGETGWHGQPASVRLRLPPLGALWLTPA